MARGKRGTSAGAGVAIGVGAGALLLGLAWALRGQADQPLITSQPANGASLPKPAHTPPPDMFDRTPERFVPSQSGYDNGYDGGPAGIVLYPDYALGVREKSAGMPRRNLAANPPTRAELFPELAKTYEPLDPKVPQVIEL